MPPPQSEAVIATEPILSVVSFCCIFLTKLPKVESSGQDRHTSGSAQPL